MPQFTIATNDIHIIATLAPIADLMETRRAANPMILFESFGVVLSLIEDFARFDLSVFDDPDEIRVLEKQLGRAQIVVQQRIMEEGAKTPSNR